MSTRPRFFRLSPRFAVADSGRVTFMNPYSWLVNRDRGVEGLEAFTIYADGIGLVWLYNLFCRASVGRYAFDYSSVAQRVFDDARLRHRAVFLVGGPEGVARAAGGVIARRHPGLQIAGALSGFFACSDDYRDALAEAARADVVVVGMGAPAQEKFLDDLWSGGWRGAGYTCGGFLEQIVGTDGDYFPSWANRLQLRWLFRLIKEPRRLWKRYLLLYPKFLVLFVVDWARLRGRAA